MLYTTSPSDIGIGRMQDISKFTDLLLKYIHLQKLNTHVLNSLREESRRPGGREEFDNKDFSCKYRALEWAIESTLSETKMLCSHAELVLKRAKNAAALVRSIVFSRCVFADWHLNRCGTWLLCKPTKEFEKTREAQIIPSKPSCRTTNSFKILHIKRIRTFKFSCRIANSPKTPRKP